MNNSTNSSSFEDLHYGRQRIILDYEEVTKQNIIEILEKAIEIHNNNKEDCNYLIDYVLGKQDILNRSASETSNINNRVVVNHAYPTTREIIGYTLGSPIELTAVKMEDKADVEVLNNTYNYEEMYVVDTNAATYASICGVGYYITLPSPDITKDNTPEIPMISEALDPRTTFVVQSTMVTNPQLMSCHYVETEDHTIYTCYTNTHKFIVTDMETVKVENNPIGYDPITMLENSLFLTGDWEQAIPVMNATNLVASDSLNEIEGTIRSILVLIGSELDEDDDSALSTIKKNRLLQLTSPQGSNVDAKFISPSLDATTVQNIRDYLDDVRNIITGIPDRDTTTGGGDTGAAVLNRNGWTDIEIVAKLKELFIKKAKKKQLAVAISILKNLNLISDTLLAMNVDVNIDRHRMDGLTNRASAFATLIATKELATIDCLEMTGLTNRAAEMVERGKVAKQERQQEAIHIAQQGAGAVTNNQNKEEADTNVADTNKNIPTE